MQTAALLLAACGINACAPAAFLPYRPDQPLTVTLPVARAGVIDARPAFATLFATELAAAGDTRPASWLHGIDASAAPTAAPADLHATFAARASSTSVLIVNGLFGDCLSAQSVPFGDGVARSPERRPRSSYCR